MTALMLTPLERQKTPFVTAGTSAVITNSPIPIQIQVATPVMKSMQAKMSGIDSILSMDCQRGINWGRNMNRTLLKSVRMNGRYIKLSLLTMDCGF